MVGTTQKAWVVEYGKDQKYVVAHTRNYAQCLVPRVEGLIGKCVNVRVESAEKWCVKSTLISIEDDAEFLPQVTDKPFSPSLCYTHRHGERERDRERERERETFSLSLSLSQSPSLSISCQIAVHLQPTMYQPSALRTACAIFTSRMRPPHAPRSDCPKLKMAHNLNTRR